MNNLKKEHVFLVCICVCMIAYCLHKDVDYEQWLGAVLIAVVILSLGLDLYNEKNHIQDSEEAHAREALQIAIDTFGCSKWLIVILLAQKITNGKRSSILQKIHMPTKLCVLTTFPREAALGCIDNTEDLEQCRALYRQGRKEFLSIYEETCWSKGISPYFTPTYNELTFDVLPDIDKIEEECV